MDKNMAHSPLDVPAPHHFTFAVRDLPDVTIEQRERALNATHWNEFAFPAGMLTVDMLSDSGTTAMTNQQWERFAGESFTGFDTDRTMLRISAMNLMLHSITHPKIEYKDSVSKQNQIRDRYTICLANPPFAYSLMYACIASGVIDGIWSSPNSAFTSLRGAL